MSLPQPDSGRIFRRNRSEWLGKFFKSPRPPESAGLEKLNMRTQADFRIVQTHADTGGRKLTSFIPPNQICPIESAQIRRTQFFSAWVRGGLYSFWCGLGGLHLMPPGSTRILANSGWTTIRLSYFHRPNTTIPTVIRIKLIMFNYLYQQNISIIMDR